MRFKELMEGQAQEYLALILGKPSDKAVEVVLNHFLEEELRHKFYDFYRELSNIYEILSPDAFLRPYLEDYDTLSRMYRILKEAYESGLAIDRELARKTAKLVQEHTTSSKIKASLEVYEINENLLRKLEKINASPTEKVFNLFRSIENLVSKEAQVNPYLVPIGERAEALAKQFRERLKSAEEVLEGLKKLIEEINQARREAAEKDMRREVFAIYWLLKPKVKNAEEIARETLEAFEKYPHWQASEEQERKLKIELNKVLIKKAGLPPKKAAELTKDIIIKSLRRTSHD